MTSPGVAGASASANVPATPDAVFRVLIDLARLSEWNQTVATVLELPPELEPGAEWVVEMHALGQSWPSRSRLEIIDHAERRFAYRACTDDGNPSYALWAWTVDPHPSGSRVTVTWELHPATFWRRLLLARIRARRLARTEVPASLRALGRAAAHGRWAVSG